MAIELNISKAAIAVADGTKLSEDQGAAQSAKLGAVLGGENVKVTSGVITDLEKLVARLKSESEDTKLSVSQRRLSILQTVLNSMAGRISDAQKNNILDIETLSMEKSGLEAELAGLNSDKTASEGRISLLDAQIESLEKQIEQAVEDGADHREQVAKLKAQRAEEQAKLDQITVAIKSLSSRVADIDGRIAKCTEAIGTATLSEVSNALRAAAGENMPKAERPESDAERRKAEEKAEATDVAKRISEALDKIDEQIRQTLAEAQELVKA